MEKFFATAGPVKANINYCMPPLDRIDVSDLEQLIAQEKYFLLHAPRQTGKTGCLLALMEYLNKQGIYKCVYANIEMAQAFREDVQNGMMSVARAIATSARTHLNDSSVVEILNSLVELNAYGNIVEEMLSLWAQASERPIVLLLDEVDALVGDTLISLLRQLRAGYSNRPESFPQSVLLCGVRDIQDYRIYSSADKSVITGGSAFNIKAESLKLGNFTKADIIRLYEQHTTATGQKFEAGVYDLIWSYTAGQPWLVNAVAYEACNRMAIGKNRANTITVSIIAEAKENLVKRRETHLDQLVDKLSEPRVRRIIEPILIGEENVVGYLKDDVEYVKDLGLITEQPNGLIDIANEIYREVIPRELTYDKQRGIYQDQVWYVKPDGCLDMAKMLEAFRTFYRENSESWIEALCFRPASPSGKRFTYMTIWDKVGDKKRKSLANNPPAREQLNVKPQKQFEFNTYNPGVARKINMSPVLGICTSAWFPTAAYHP